MIERRPTKAITAIYRSLWTLCVSLLFLSASTLSAQVVTGTITDENGGLLPGTSVVEKGTTNGTQTDFDGQYQIELTGDNAVLQYSYIGYQAKEIAVGGQTNINIQMELDVAGLDEVVVVGYGTSKKQDIITAISDIDSEQIEKNTTPSFTQALQGTLAGVQAVSSGGDPTADTRILIRGVSSISTATEPLFIVDGIPVASGGTSPLNYINPLDIASVTVLKDAGATAIYGSRGANGVVLITTKTGKPGRGELILSSETGMTVPINDLELADGNEWRSMVAQGRANNGLPTTGDFVIGLQRLYDLRQNQRYQDLDVYNTSNENWIDKMQQNAFYQQYSLSASNATEKTSYFASGQYRTQEGNFVGTNFDRLTARINLDFQPTDYLKLGIRYSFIYENNKEREDLPNAQNFNRIANGSPNPLNNGVGPQFETLYSDALPIYPEVWPDDGSPFDPFSGRNLTFADQDGQSLRTTRFTRNIGSVFTEFTPLKGLVARAEFGVNYRTGREKDFRNLRIATISEEDQANTDPNFNPLRDLDYLYTDGTVRNVNREVQNFSYNAIGTLAYETIIKEDHNVSVLIGVERNYSKSRGFTVTLDDSNSLQDPTEIGAFIRDASQFVEITNNIGPERRFSSSFGRLAYNYKNKYYFQGSLRRDGSSVFSPDDRFSWFPAASVGWVVSKESFLQSEALNFLKLRGSWGITGNANIGDFQFFDSYLVWPNYPDRTRAAIQEQSGAARIQWERSTTLDVGLDFGVFKNRITGSLGYYRSENDNLLLEFPTDPTVGIYHRGDGRALANVGSIENSGIELELMTRNISTPNFNWTTSFNFSTNKNKVLDLYPGFEGDPRTFSYNGLTSILEGAQLGQFFLPSFAGYDSDGVMLIREIDQDILASENRYVFTGQNVRNVGVAANENSIVQEGKQGLPTFFGGLGNTFEYKGLSLYFLFSFQGGNYIYDDLGLRNIGTGAQVLRKDLVGNTWTPDNPNSEYPVLLWGGIIDDPDDPINNPQQAVSDRSNKWLTKADFLRLRTVSLTYDFGRAFPTSSKLLKGTSVFLNLQNVATFSKFDTLDPEFIGALGEAAEFRNFGQGVLNRVPLWQVFTASIGARVRL